MWVIAVNNFLKLQSLRGNDTIRIEGGNIADFYIAVVFTDATDKAKTEELENARWKTKRNKSKHAREI